MVLGYLQGLALDAYTTAGRGAKWAICTDSPNLMDDVQAVLNNLGVLTSRISKYNRHYDKHFEEVYATGEHARRLIDLVPFAEVHKRDRVARTREAVVGRSPGTSDVVPGISPADLYRCLPLDPTDPAPNPLRAEFAFLRDPGPAMSRDEPWNEWQRCTERSCLNGFVWCWTTVSTFRRLQT